MHWPLQGLANSPKVSGENSRARWRRTQHARAFDATLTVSERGVCCQKLRTKSCVLKVVYQFHIQLRQRERQSLWTRRWLLISTLCVTCQRHAGRHYFCGLQASRGTDSRASIMPQQRSERSGSSGLEIARRSANLSPAPQTFLAHPVMLRRCQCNYFVYINSSTKNRY